MDCRDSALFTGVDEASCENMLRCFSAYEQRFSAGQTILTCGEQQDMIGVLLSGSAALLRLHADGNRTVLESMDEGSVFGEELAFTGFRDGSALIECREDCRVIFMRYDQITKRCENACACHSQVVTNLFQLLSKKSLHLSRRIEVLACRSIREKLLWNLEKEIPHGTAVVIEKMKTRDNGMLDIDATIFCEKETHKRIIIGKNGSMLKKISTFARQDIERFFDCRVFLQTWVKVKEDWRNRAQILQNFGYDEKNFD